MQNFRVSWFYLHVSNLRHFALFYNFFAYFVLKFDKNLYLCLILG